MIVSLLSLSCNRSSACDRLRALLDDSGAAPPVLEAGAGVTDDAVDTARCGGRRLGIGDGDVEFRSRREGAETAGGAGVGGLDFPLGLALARMTSVVSGRPLPVSA